jgi:hypothetical protein
MTEDEITKAFNGLTNMGMSAATAANFCAGWVRGDPMTAKMDREDPAAAERLARIEARRDAWVTAARRGQLHTIGEALQQAAFGMDHQDKMAEVRARHELREKGVTPGIPSWQVDAKVKEILARPATQLQHAHLSNELVKTQRELAASRWRRLRRGGRSEDLDSGADLRYR